MLYELKEYVGLLIECRGESGWCSDVTSTHGAWRHAGVRFPLSGDKIYIENRRHLKSVAERGFDPRTFGLWAQHANRCATPLLESLDRAIQQPAFQRKPQWDNEYFSLMRMPGVEPGSQAWEACMIPLHYMRREYPVTNTSWWNQIRKWFSLQHIQHTFQQTWKSLQACAYNFPSISKR
jgi:hypothetical protein